MIYSLSHFSFKLVLFSVVSDLFAPCAACRIILWCFVFIVLLQFILYSCDFCDYDWSLSSVS